jgi:hypothetical protein
MRRIFTFLFFAASLNSIGQATNGTAAAFTAGNIVVYRVGDSSAALSSGATSVFLDEYTPLGVRVQSIPLPTTVNGANRRVTASGTATSEGLITRSTDGRFLLATGYDTTVGAASITGIAGSTLRRTVAVVDNAGNVNSTTALPDFASGSNPRGAASPDGVNLWLTGGAGGVRYATVGASSSTAVTSDITNLRAVHIFNGQLYISTASGSAVRVGTVGTGLPTTTGQTTTNLPGFPTTTSPYQFFFADLNPAIPGVDVLYVADDAAATGIQKYSYTGSTWVANGNLVPTPSGTRGLTGVVTGTSVTLYTTTINALYALVDASGYNNNITGAFTSLASAPTNTAFRGVALAPTAVALPLTLTSFNASFNGSAAQLTWKSVNEVSVKGFSIERSIDGVTFTEIAFVNANNLAGENSYSYKDNSITSGANYYRIKTVGKDGALKLSQVLVINNRAGIKASVFPNPVTSSLTVNHTSATLGAKLSVLTLEGKLIKSLSVQQGAVQTSVSVSELIKGNYLLIYENSGAKTTTKFSKQ